LVALLGVNGAGRTTATSVLSGLSNPTSGDAILLADSIDGRLRCTISDYLTARHSLA